tara:strand:+ start:178 stop:312 length:135 start_codon:yes stop_codon:yes gene_type:complete
MYSSFFIVFEELEFLIKTLKYNTIKEKMQIQFWCIKAAYKKKKA